MAERRMFAKSIVTSDAFLDMPMSARCLYFTLGMFADDDGFVNNPKSITRQIGASEDDMKVLLAKKFVLAFDSGVIVIKHWRINNYLRNDRYHKTNYIEEKETLLIDENGAYTNNGIPMVDQRYTEDSIGKDSIGENIKKENIKKEKPVRNQIPPTFEMVRDYCIERGNSIDAEKFCDFYESKGWYVGKTKMKDWQATVRTWEKQNGDKVSSADKARLEEGRKAQAENEQRIEEEHQVEMERYKREHPDEWAQMEEDSKTLSLSDIIKKAVG